MFVQKVMAICIAENFFWVAFKISVGSEGFLGT